MVATEYCVYKHTCPNGKVYIGITKQNPLARWRNGKGYKSNKRFFSAITKYGWDNITHEILYAGLTATEAERMERALIKEYKSTERQYGYNYAEGGLAPTPSEETRNKISKSMLEQYARGLRSRERSEDAKRSTSATLKQRFASGEIVRVISNEQKKKLSAAHCGKSLSESHKEKIKKNSHRKPVAQYEGDIVINIYSGVREAGRATGIDYTGIIKVLKGIKRSAGGYSWEYIESDITLTKTQEVT